MDELERTIAEMESIFTDPEIESTLVNVKEFNDLIATEPASTLDGLLVIEELNRKWREKNLYGKEMFATGRMLVGGKFKKIQDIAEAAYTESDVVDKAFISRGFSLLNEIMEKDGDISIKQRIIMRGRTEVEDKKGIGGISNEACGIIIDAQTIIECREDTPAKTAAWLDVYHPDIKQEIDACIVASNDESEATMLLQSLRIPIEGTSEQEIELQQKHYELYLQEVNSYEQHVVYLANLMGECQVHNADTGTFEDKVISSIKESMLLLSDLFLKIDSESNEFIMHIRGTLVGISKTDSYVINMPLSTIASLAGGRDILRKH